MKTTLKTAGLLCAALALAAPPAAHAQKTPAKPNVIVILADDLGYSDLGCHGGKDIPTPNIDSLAKNGVRCTNGYVSCPYCSPTRAGLITGRYQTRFGHEFNEGGVNRETFGLPLTETTIAQRMKALGYATAAVGKWHLGYRPDMRPMKRGFDEFYGTLANTPFLRPMLVDSRVGPDPKRVEDENFYTTDAYADRIVDLVGKFKGKPFFLYLPFNACHVPIQATKKYLDRFKDIEDKNRRGYAAMLSAMDDAVGRMLGALRDNKLEEDTLIFFVSDNGGPMTKMGLNGSNNRPLKGQKGDTWEGAIRVPFLVQWKGKLPAGKVYDQPVIQLDIAATAVVAGGGKVDPAWKLDGVDLLPYLTDRSKGRPHETLYWRFGPQWAVRRGDWKLVQGFDYEEKGNDKVPVWKTKVTRPMLFNLAEDRGETKDLADKHPEKVKELRDAWEAWNKEQAKPLWLPMPAKKKK
jgi:arylsulfatase A-like enzyme